MKRNKTALLLLFFLALGFALRLNQLSPRSLWTDEFFTLFQASGHGREVNGLVEYYSKFASPRLVKAAGLKLFLKNDPAKNLKDVACGLLYTDTHPPLYFLIMHIWMKFFGDSVFAVRFFSLLAGLLAILAAYKVGEKLFNKETAVFSALFTAISCFSVRYSQEARSYSLVMLIGLLSWLFLLRFEKGNKNLDAVIFAFLNAAGIYVHYFYGFISLAQFLYFEIARNVLSCRHSEESRNCGTTKNLDGGSFTRPFQGFVQDDTRKAYKFHLAFLFSLLLLFPWYLRVVLKGYNFVNTEWIFGQLGFMNKVFTLINGLANYIFLSEGPTVISSFFLLAAMPFFIFTAFFGLKDACLKYRRQFLFCLMMFLLPLLSMFLIDIVQHGALLRQERFWMFSFIGLIPLAGYSLSYLFSRNRLAAIILVLVILAFSLKSSFSTFAPAPKYVSEWINRESLGRRSAVFIYNTRSVIFSQAYYLDGRIYLAPISNDMQLIKALKEARAANLDTIFIARHYHWTDPSLMDQPFFGMLPPDMSFKFKSAIERDKVRVSEYVKCGL